ncbi:MAG: CCA tRNA nucleotidyltransferase [Candidatus Bathyarchaeota archaeon]|jgi:tRNA nucleotidyltransferase (CCA-adding enzyme)
MARGSSWEEIRQRVLEKIVPGREEEDQVKGFCYKIEEELTERLRTAGYSASAEVHGSVARGTWIKGERDLDIFIALEDDHDRDDLPEVLEVVKNYVGEGWVEAYAEHPYISAELNGFRVEFVPCFKVDPKEGILSATDRTPLHTGFVNERLPVEKRIEVRLLKRFMKGLGVYGAEVRVRGFSGYLCELLVIALGSFEGVLEAATIWRLGEVVDPIGSADPKYLRKRFSEPLIVQDPVDPRRNVASAVSEENFWEFSAASEAFFREPKMVFFFPDEQKPNVAEVSRLIRSWALDLVFIEVRDGNVEVPDVLWGQLYRSERALAGALGEAGFEVVRSGVWSDETSRHVFIFEIMSALLPGLVRRKGPPVWMAEDGRRFLDAHLTSEGPVSGPWIEGDRWWALVKRRENDAVRVTVGLLENGGRGIGVSPGIADRIEEGYRVFLGSEVELILDRDLAGFLEGFLKGRPSWLE